MIWILFDYFFALLHFSLYVYTYLRLGPDGEKLIYASDNQKTLEDLVDTPKI